MASLRRVWDCIQPKNRASLGDWRRMLLSIGELVRSLLPLSRPSLRQHLRLASTLNHHLRLRSPFLLRLVLCVWCSYWLMILQSLVVVFILLNQCLAKGVDEMFDHSELVGGSWRWAYQALCSSCGYFAYDQWDMLQYRLYSGLIPSILVHHLVLLVCFTLALYRNVTINYLILTLICEVRFK